MGGEGCGRGEKFAGAPLPPKKRKLAFLTNAAHPPKKSQFV